jgi:hypothetical protein
LGVVEFRDMTFLRTESGVTNGLHAVGIHSARANAAFSNQPPPAQAPSRERLAEIPVQAGPAAPPVAREAEIPAPGQRRVEIDGREVPLPGDGTTFPETSTSMGIPDIPPNVYQLGIASIIGLSTVLVAFPVFGFLKALVNRRALAAPATPRDLTDRLQRIENAVDAMSVEVERISEGQRFVTKALSERSSAVDR